VYFKLGETFMLGFFKSRLVLRFVVLLLLAGALAVSLASITHSRSALAYGKENWQVTAAGTGVFPGTGVGFGFWGWCAFGGGVTSGNNGDCEFSQYFHAPAGSGFTCEISLDITSWDGSGGTFVVTGTATVNPTSQTGPCLAFFPGSASFTGVDTGIPAAPGHFNLGGIGGLRGEFQIQVAQIP
jgi:hypothetical protein